MLVQGVVGYLVRKTITNQANLLKISDPHVMPMLENMGEKWLNGHSQQFNTDKLS
jgi:hypothetical protein